MREEKQQVSLQIACNGLRVLDLLLERLGSDEFERYVEKGNRSCSCFQLIIDDLLI